MNKKITPLFSAFLLLGFLGARTAFAQATTPEAPTPEIVVPTEVPTLVPTIEVPTLVPPTLELPTMTPLPTLPPPTPSLPPPTVRAETSSIWMVGQPGEIAFILDTTSAAPINSLEAQCSLPPTSLVSVQVVPGVYAPDALVINNGLQGDGTWIFAVAQPSAPLPAGALFRLTAFGALSGGLNINCLLTGVGMDGARLPLAFMPFMVVVADAPTQMPSETPPPSWTPIPEVLPEITPTLDAPIEPTPTLEVPAEPSATPGVPVEVTLTVETSPQETPGTEAALEPSPTSEATLDPTPTLEAVSPTEAPAPLPNTVAGEVSLSDSAPTGVVVSLRAADGAVVMLGVADDSGQYRFDAVPPGNYVVVVEAAGYLSDAQPVMLGEGGAALAPIELFAGDIVPSDPSVIDELDVVQFTAWYGDPNAYDLRGDFNRDGRIDVMDLRALAQNMRRGG